MPKVTVHNDNFERAMRKFKKKVTNSGLLIEVRERKFYKKPSEVRNAAKAAARMRWKKYLRDQQNPKKEF